MHFYDNFQYRFSECFGTVEFMRIRSIKYSNEFKLFFSQLSLILIFSGSGIGFLETPENCRDADELYFFFFAAISVMDSIDFNLITTTHDKYVN
jgi:hypothetical protein